jgi:hypothetical protein
VEANGDNLLAIYDSATSRQSFAIEALGLVDHFNFLDKYAAGAKGKTKPAASPRPLRWQRTGTCRRRTSGRRRTFDPNDLHCVDRVLFAG